MTGFQRTGFEGREPRSAGSHLRTYGVEAECRLHGGYWKTVLWVGDDGRCRHRIDPARSGFVPCDECGAVAMTTTCPECEQDRRRKADAFDRRKNDPSEDALKERGLVGRLSEYSFASYDLRRGSERAWRCVRDVTRRGTGTVVLIGPVGVGKTHLLSAAVRSVRRARYTTAIRMVRDVRDADRIPFDSINERVDWWSRVRLLAIDEIGHGFGTESERRTLFEILDQRITRRLPTVMAGNGTAREILEVLGPRTADRIRSYGTVVPVVGTSLRRKEEGE